MIGKRKIRVLLVDGHPILLAGLRECLRRNSNIAVVGQASDHAEAIRKARRLKPQVIVLDINLPGVSGITLMQSLRLAAPDAKIIVYTIHEGKEYQRWAILGGASAFIRKSAPSSSLVRAIETAHNADGRGALAMLAHEGATHFRK